MLAVVYETRARRGRAHAFDSRIETSAAATVAYLWRLGRYGQSWARQGSGSYATSLAQLCVGLAPIMGWSGIPAAEDLPAREAFLRRHRASVQRWLDWLADCGLVTHEPEAAANGQWWRTRIRLLASPTAAEQTLERVLDRERGWSRLEHRRHARGRRRNLSAILRRARLSRSQRRRRGIANRRRRQAHADRCRVTEQVAASACQEHLRPPREPWTTSQGSSDLRSSENDSDRGMTRERECRELINTDHEASPTAAEERREADSSLSPTLAGLRQLLGSRFRAPDPSTPEGHRWSVYHEVVTEKIQQLPAERQSRLEAQARRRRQLLTWDSGELPPMWWLAELFVAATYTPEMAAAPHGFRLAFLIPEREQHTVAQAAAFYACAAHGGALAPGRPENPVAALADWLVHHCADQDGGPVRGLAADLQGFLTDARRARAYARVTSPGRRRQAQLRAQRRLARQALAETVNARLAFRNPLSAKAQLKRARALLEGDHPAHREAGQRRLGALLAQERQSERDLALAGGSFSDPNDASFLAARRYAERWGLPSPTERLRQAHLAEALAVLEAAKSELGRRT